MTSAKRSTVVRAVLLPFTVLYRVLAALAGALAAVLRVAFTFLVVAVAVLLLLQFAGVGVGLGSVGDVPLPTSGGTAPGDPGATSYEYESGAIDTDDVERLVHEEVNDRRAERDVDRLEWSSTVASVARAHSRDMADRDYFAHQNPDGQGPYDRYQDVASGCRSYGENIATTWFGTPVSTPDGDVEEYETEEELAVALTEQWMNSDGHRENMLRDDWETGGVGVYVTDDGQVYATHNFCREWV